jgi:hypothetical protein
MGIQRCPVKTDRTDLASETAHENQLVEGLLGRSFLDTLPARLIGEKAYDSDRLDRDLAELYGIELIALHRGRRRTPTQDGRTLRRYRRRLASRTTVRMAPSFSSTNRAPVATISPLYSA